MLSKISKALKPEHTLRHTGVTWLCHTGCHDMLLVIYLLLKSRLLQFLSLLPTVNARTERAARSVSARCHTKPRWLLKFARQEHVRRLRWREGPSRRLEGWGTISGVTE